jgi:hypothetical protein
MANLTETTGSELSIRALLVAVLLLLAPGLFAQQDMAES